MATCDAAHRDYDRFANKEVQSGELPGWMNIKGKVCFYVYQGPYSGLSQAWPTFMGKAQATFSGKVTGPPGDVYICDPTEHTGSAERTLITILWAPMKD